MNWVRRTIWLLLLIHLLFVPALYAQQPLRSTWDRTQSGLSYPAVTRVRAEQDLHLKPDVPLPYMEGNVEPSLSDFSTFIPPYGMDPTGDDSTTPGSMMTDELLNEPELSHQLPLLHSSGTRLWRGHWYTEQDLVLMVKVSPRKRDFSVDVSSDQQLHTDSDTHTFEPGTRLTIGNILGRDSKHRDHSIEFTFFGMFDYDASATVRAGTDGNLFTNLGPAGFTVPAFDEANRHRFIYASDLNSYEFNLRIRSRLGKDRLVLRPDGQWVRKANTGRILTIHGGLRGLSMNEGLLFSTSGPGTDHGSLSVLTNNDMFGLQGGGELVGQHADWSWGVGATFGGLYNIAQRRHVFMTNEEGVQSNSAGEDINEQMVMLGDLRFTASWQVRPHLTLRTTYNVMYLTGLATATGNISFNPIYPPIYTRGDAFYHGLSTGLVMVW